MAPQQLKDLHAIRGVQKRHITRLESRAAAVDATTPQLQIVIITLLESLDEAWIGIKAAHTPTVYSA